MNDHVAWELINRHKAEMLGLFNTAISTIAVVTGELSIQATLVSAQAATIVARCVFMLSDYNGQAAIFTRDDTYTVLLQGADGFTDAAGSIFKRFQNE